MKIFSGSLLEVRYIYLDSLLLCTYFKTAKHGFSLITFQRNVGSPWNFYTIFLGPEVIFNSHIMFINASTKEFTLVNNAFPSHDVALEHLLCFKMLPMFTKNMIIFFKNNTYSILICQSFPFPLVQSFHRNRDGDVGQ